MTTQGRVASARRCRTHGSEPTACIARHGAPGARLAPRVEPTLEPEMNRMRLAIVLGVVPLAAAVVGGGAALTTSGGSSPLGSAGSGSADGSSYGYYRSMMERFAGGSMMGNAYGWMTGATGFAWMMGGASAPNWMRGASLPGFMMGTNTDPGKVMGALFANAPGPLVSPAAAIRLGNAVPPGATVAA